MTATSVWRRAYHILRHDAHLTHHQVRAIFEAHFGGLAIHKNVLHEGQRQDTAAWESEAARFALALNTHDPELFIARLRAAIWEDGEAVLCYTLVRMIERTVRTWHGWDERTRQAIKDRVLRRLSRHEKRSGLAAWTDRHLHTYLQIRGLDI